MAEPPRVSLKIRPFNYPGISLICGLLSYVPLVGGAFFCAAPGIAERSWVKAAKGAAAGLGGHLLVAALGAAVFTWEPRYGYNVLIAGWYPPGYDAVTHSGSPFPNAMYVFCASGAWCVLMGLLVLGLSRQNLGPLSKTGRIGAGLLVQQGLLLVTWVTAPMDHHWHYGAAPFADLPDVPFFYVFLTSIPAYSVIVTWGLDGRVGVAGSTEGPA